MTRIDEIVTADMAKFGYREIEMARDLLDAWMKQGLPDDFEGDGVNVAFNTNSGCVFLTNSECQVAIVNGDKLESFYSCPDCGREGFKDEFEKDADCSGCREIAGADEEDEEELDAIERPVAQAKVEEDVYECEHCNAKFRKSEIMSRDFGGEIGGIFFCPRCKEETKLICVSEVSQ